MFTSKAKAWLNSYSSESHVIPHPGQKLGHERSTICKMPYFRATGKANLISARKGRGIRGTVNAGRGLRLERKEGEKSC